MTTRPVGILKNCPGWLPCGDPTAVGAGIQTRTVGKTVQNCTAKPPINSEFLCGKTVPNQDLWHQKPTLCIDKPQLVAGRHYGQQPPIPTHKELDFICPFNGFLMSLSVVRLSAGTLAVGYIRPGGKEPFSASSTSPGIASAVVTVPLPGRLKQEFFIHNLVSRHFWLFLRPIYP